MKAVAVLLLIAGVSLAGTGAAGFFQVKKAQHISYRKAEQVLKTNAAIPDHLAEKAFEPKHGAVVGMLEIPKLEARLPIIEGTDEDELEKGVGHFKGTAYPLGNDQIVLSGHRDTVFRKMGELETGDLFILKLPYGSFTYKMDSSQIVDANDRTIIKPTAPKEVLTVTTCYPFTFIGNAPERYIITALPADENINR
ncbi:class D sortase [Bacillus sp. V3-13]|uniref:class D sortase n=1 Tax=Bacillus sp. V3-13 TaxID=2053728 RepID=UPI000C765662|nr:class D sortase [Bacillus sp. V3-13]PLR77242.1 class D sortase [Bacillus sp. V3-13]